MRERPILFRDELVRAILDGRKTQTRRVMRTNHVGYRAFHRWDGEPGTRAMMRCSNETHPGSSVFCEDNRIGHPGDVLWVREAFNVGRPLRNSEGVIDDEMLWPGPLPKVDPRGKRLLDDWCVGYRSDGGDGPWRPSIHMPRWASRLTLRVTDVRVERLQDISEEDARAEGLSLHAAGWTDGATLYDTLSARDAFAELWDSLAKPGAAWADNPWCWVIAFERVVEVPRG